MKKPLLLFACLGVFLPLFAQKKVRTTTIGEGWAGNSVNAVVFRKNSVVTFKELQFVAYYNADGHVVIAKRQLKATNWELTVTPLKGNIRDAHNSISIMVDGEGYLHLAWDHHNNPLNYVVSTRPLVADFAAKRPMTGTNESTVSYPEFYSLNNGDLIFIYRDGGSGRGNLVMNRYDLKAKQWTMISNNLISGEGQRNAYWQACIDQRNAIHLSWVWRESPDVASNHDMSYAISYDLGKTWQKSTGEKYTLPITMTTAEKIAGISQKSELINQTSMTTDANNSPIIAGYWKTNAEAVPQYQLIHRLNGRWQVIEAAFRKTNFSLSGMGTKQIPISRPQVVSWQRKRKTAAAIIFRDEERGNKPSVAVNKNILKKRWKIRDLSPENLGAWEPSFDTELWRSRKLLHLFTQRVTQADGEGVTQFPPTPVQIIESKF